MLNFHQISIFIKLAFYYVFALFLYILALPYILYLLTKPKYREALPARFFPFMNKAPQVDTIRFHTCSYGETASMKEIAAHFGDSVHFSVTTQTGYDEASKWADKVSFLPYEIFLPCWEKRSRIIIVAEAELWLLLFATAKLKGSKTVLINARISDKSHQSYKRFGFFYRFLFSFVDLVLAQSDSDADRLRELGAKDIFVTGNTKVSQKHTPTTNYPRDAIKLTVVAASTHFGEEEIAFSAFCEAFANGGAKLIIVPRHPERFDSVCGVIENECRQKNLTFTRFSTAGSFDSDVTVVDMMGELINVYAISDIAIVCGSFANIGGHNPIEPAQFGCKIITGSNIHNHKATFDAVDGYTMCSADELASVLKNHQNLPQSTLNQEKDPATLALSKINELLTQ